MTYTTIVSIGYYVAHRTIRDDMYCVCEQYSVQPLVAGNEHVARSMDKQRQNEVLHFFLRELFMIISSISQIQD